MYRIHSPAYRFARSVHFQKANIAFLQQKITLLLIIRQLANALFSRSRPINDQCSASAIIADLVLGFSSFIQCFFADLNAFICQFILQENILLLVVCTTNVRNRETAFSLLNQIPASLIMVLPNLR